MTQCMLLQALIFWVWVRHPCCLFPWHLHLSRQSRHMTHTSFSLLHTPFCVSLVTLFQPRLLDTCVSLCGSGTLVFISLLHLRVKWGTQGVAKVSGKAQVTSPALLSLRVQIISTQHICSGCLLGDGHSARHGEAKLGKTQPPLSLRV